MLLDFRKTGSGWEFASEEVLEDFVYKHCETLFNCTVLGQQYNVRGQICDLVAVDKKDKSLVILELKNTEDRYIIQQLTRYYDALVKVKPFLDQINYSNPVQLIAVTPSFHQDNFTDIRYHLLDFTLVEFTLIQSHRYLNLHLNHLNSNKISKLKIPYEIQDKNDAISTPSKSLRNIISICSEQEQQKILDIRQHLLTFDHRMSEQPFADGVKYGKGKKTCLELRLDRDTNQPVIFLWLPLLTRRGGTSRMRIWTDWGTVSDIAYVKNGVGNLYTKSDEAEAFKKERQRLEKQGKHKHNRLRPKYNRCTLKSPYQATLTFAMSFSEYMAEIQIWGKLGVYDKIQATDYRLDKLIDYALEIWHSKL